MPVGTYCRLQHSGAYYNKLAATRGVAAAFHTTR